MTASASTRRLLLLAAALLPAAVRAAEPTPSVEFNRDIRPLLSDNCFFCHGPDQGKRKANLRLDDEESARRVLAAGDPAGSELYRRITAEDEAKRMPPAKSGRRLTPQQTDLVRRWIEQGAKWQKHWAFLPPRRPPTPAVKDTRWPRNGIDNFVLARLEQEGLKPSPEADRLTLLRRVTLDLTGLPPTPEEADAFLADQSPDAYERVVDRLLASPRYGERMAIRWLEAARYADTNGYQSDGERFMWRWRDWVIDAFNSNMPFDRFTVEQLAGDLLPNATLEQKIATGFNRNHRGNGEGGVIAEEYAVEYVADRVETTATVWLGLTVGCARCHDHKFDPVKQKEFYQLFAFFNNVPENGKAIKYGNSPPYAKAPTPRQQEELHQLEDRLKAAEQRFAGLATELDAAQRRWEGSLDGNADWATDDGLVAHLELDDGGKFVDGDAAFAEGRRGRAAVFDGRRYLDGGDVADFGFYDKFSLAAWVKSRPQDGGTVLSRTADEPKGEGYAVALRDGKVQVNLVKRWLDDALRVETEERLDEGWHHVLVTYDGSRVAAGVKVYVDGRPAKLTVLLDELNQSFETKEPFRVGAGGGPAARFRGLIDEVRVYDRILTPDEAEALATPDSLTAIAAVPAERRSSGQAKKLRACFLERHAPDAVRQAWRDVISLRRERDRLLESFPTTMVMEEMPTPRDTFVLQRGAYDRRGEKVGPGTPAVLSPWPDALKKDRLGLARWLVVPDNPLTARVAVNRMWQTFFGVGLVKTVDDFGSQGEPPSHPELLDWLATEFMASGGRESPGWDVKRLQRLIVTSATYRQSSRLTKELLQRDPDNRLLARGPRLRLPAEMVRDQALAASGLLVERLGGPSVRPYQPAGLIRELTGGDDYKQDHGPDLYRRGLYTFWKRTVAPPMMTTFDAALRETCVVRQTRTNTPLQALTLLNDVTFVEAARVLAQRVMREAATPEERLTRAFRLLTGRPPRPAELKVLADGLRRHREDFAKDLDAARKLVGVGESPPDPALDVTELAAYTAVASLILNLDETITRE